MCSRNTNLHYFNAFHFTLGGFVSSFNIFKKKKKKKIYFMYTAVAHRNILKIDRLSKWTEKGWTAGSSRSAEDMHPHTGGTLNAEDKRESYDSIIFNTDSVWSGES